MAGTVCLIPARLGSKRLPKKNLSEIEGVSLLERAIRKAHASDAFDEVWVSSESEILGDVAVSAGAQFHLRPQHLGSDHATSEDFVADFLKDRTVAWLVQLHSIAPLLRVDEVIGFVDVLKKGKYDCLFSVLSTRLEAVFDGEPVNFSFNSKTNSQDLKPVKEIVWSITGWNAATFMDAHSRGECATYFGRRGFHEISALAGHVIKTQWDLDVARRLFPLVGENHA